MVTKRKEFVPISYTSRDFESLRRELNEFRRRYYSNISVDENQSSFDDMMQDLVAYVGDQLSFYLDYQANESFLPTAIEFNNIINHGRVLGYKFRGNPSSFGTGTFFAIIPANSTGLGPDSRYLFTLKRGTEVASVNGNGFLLNEDINFADSRNEVVVARTDTATGVPTAYAIKVTGQIISGKIVEEIIEVGSFQKFLRLELAAENVSEVLSVLDDEGNEYFEVENLSQDLVFRPVVNRDSTTNQQAPNILKPFIVPRRFVVERDRVSTFLQFGFGSENDVASDPLIDPSRVVLDVFGKDHITDTTFDPTNILGTDKMGIAPANTRLRVSYRVNTAENVNAAQDSITRMVNPIVQFEDPSVLSSGVIRSIIDSLEVTNERRVVGDVSTPEPNELKRRIFGSFGSQDRAVTLQDYKAVTYAMPPRFGSIKRVNAVQDPDSFSRNLNLYVLSEDENAKFTLANSVLKENLRLWILRRKMINDTIDIIDGKILNLGINFIVVGDPEKNKFEIRERCVRDLTIELNRKLDLGEDFSITKIYEILKEVDDVTDVVSIKVFQKNGGNYSDLRFNVDNTISADGRYISIPANVVAEVKFPDTDIRGAVR